MRRCLDVMIAGTILLLTAPLVGLAALALRLSGSGQIVFRQERGGRHGVPFTIFKLRTMREPAYSDEPDADRLTTLGRLLRATSVDELPQLVNVLLGDMSIIGPRPTLMDQVVRYDERQRGRLAVRPGITGWAQVNGRNSLSWPERIELDLWYVQHRHLGLDLKILALTVLQVVHPRGVTGAGGVNPGLPDHGRPPSEEAREGERRQ